MSNQTVSPLGVFLAGSFNGFSATADSMIAVGNGVYEITLSLDTTLSVQYKFVNGNTYETGNAACGVDDGFGGYNRVFEVVATNDSIPTVCFNECANCVPVGLINNEALNVSIYPNPVKDNLYVNFVLLQEQTQFQIINQVGSTVASGNLLSNNTNISLTGLAKGIYFIKIINNNDIQVKRFVKE
jgi:hypothetical protein